MKNFLMYKKFFDEKGLTSTSANYISNIAKEIVNTYNDINRISFENVDVETLGSDKIYRIKEGMKQDVFNNLEQSLTNKAKLYALISWLREAIKAREYQLEEVEDYNLDEWLAEYKDMNDDTFGIEMPTADKSEFEHITKDEYITKNFTIKEINEYFFLQNMCAVLGKFVHPEGSFSSAKKYIEKNDGTSNLKETTSANLLHKINSSIPLEEINEKFFMLQDKQREYQKRFNSIMFNVENEVRKYNDSQDAKYALLKSQQKEAMAKREAKRHEYNIEFQDWKTKELNRIRSQKIVIPNDLQETYEFVNNYGKTK